MVIILEWQDSGDIFSLCFLRFHNAYCWQSLGRDQGSPRNLHIK